jgi:hypothetical protein
MIKLLFIVFVTVAIFTGALYTGIFGMLWDYIITFTTDFLPYIPNEFRLWFFLVFLWIVVSFAKSFIN